MTTLRRQLLRRLETRAGIRYLVQVPHDQTATPGWRSYDLLALGPDDNPPLRLTLFERAGRFDDDGPRAA
jgi:hypothetical protein